MAIVEVYTNNATTTVSSGGTTAPASGTTETWIVNSSTLFPAVTNGVNQFHVADPAATTETVAVTNISGNTWTVTRGAENSTPVIHATGFTIYQVVTAGVLAALPQLAGATFTGYVAPAVSALTFGASIAINAALGNAFSVTLTASTGTLANPTNPVDGQVIRIRVIQDATGTRTLAYGTAYDFGSAGAPVLSTAANKVDILGFEYVASLAKWCYLGSALGN